MAHIALLCPSKIEWIMKIQVWVRKMQIKTQFYLKIPLNDS